MKVLIKKFLILVMDYHSGIIQLDYDRILESYESDKYVRQINVKIGDKTISVPEFVIRSKMEYVAALIHLSDLRNEICEEIIFELNSDECDIIYNYLMGLVINVNIENFYQIYDLA